MNAIAKLKNASYKLTRPRRIILNFLTKQRTPKTISEIYAGTKRQIDQASVYRTVELLQSLGIIYDEYLLDDHRYYLAESPHHHIVCRHCHKIECLPCHVEFTPPKDFTVIAHSLSLTGLCTSCS